eukprot:907857-Alexandrium_andersonii.AAC.1
MARQQAKDHLPSVGKPDKILAPSGLADPLANDPSGLNVGVFVGLNKPENGIPGLLNQDLVGYRGPDRTSLVFQLKGP